VSLFRTPLVNKISGAPTTKPLELSEDECFQVSSKLQQRKETFCYVLATYEELTIASED